MFRNVIDRRRLLGLAGAGGSLLVMPHLARAQAEEITIQIWGTTWTGSMRRVSQMFEQKTGIKVNVSTQANAAEGLVRLQSMRQAPNIDVWFTTNSVADRVKGDAQLFKTLDYTKLPAAAAIEPGARNSGWVGLYFYPLGIVWRSDMLADPITSWKELWEPRFAQKLCVPSMNMFQARMLLVAATINGGGISNVEPGFEALKRLKPNVVAWYSSDNTARQGLAQGEYPILIAPPAALKRMIDSNVPARMISPPPAPMMYDVMMQVNTAKAEMSAAFIDFCLGQEAQEIIAQGQGMAPVHPNAKPLDEIAQAVPASSDRVTYDDSIINANIAAWNERFNREIAS